MYKTDFIKAVAKKAGLSQKDAQAFYNAFVETTCETMKKKERISLRGFGSFYTVDKKAHTARVPQTGKSIQVPAKTIMKFTPSAVIATVKKGRKTK
ncbi:MAG: HU family DNA-binding protein [Bacteroidales bacterium]|nr:HU family DNA-binding protein [Bacteroidales bacterium]